MLRNPFSLLQTANGQGIDRTHPLTFRTHHSRAHLAAADNPSGLIPFTVPMAAGRFQRTASALCAPANWRFSGRFSTEMDTDRSPPLRNFVRDTGSLQVFRSAVHDEFFGKVFSIGFSAIKYMSPIYF